MGIASRVQARIRRELVLLQNSKRLNALRTSISTRPDSSQHPVLFFNASTRLSGISQNASFSLLTSLALERQGIPVVHLVCQSGLSRCMLGTNKDNANQLPPCAECMRTSRLIFSGAHVNELHYSRDVQLEKEIANLNLEDLLHFSKDGFPAGQLILPSLRWILRRHHLQDDEGTCKLAREFIMSAWNVKVQGEALIKRLTPRCVVVFNGMTFPEAALRWVARKMGLVVFSHEVGMLPFSVFFTDQEATAYPVSIDDAFQLNTEQNKALDKFLENRFKGSFVTAGVKFWPEMKAPGEVLLKKAEDFKNTVAVFTNVIFDTSQSHANVLFDHMFDWLDQVLVHIKSNPDTLFIIRAHPDELRLGKESRESVADWVALREVSQFPNLVFIPSDQYISSYDLIRMSKFVMVYNSTIGLEASIMGKPVLCAGRARYTQIPTVFFPPSREAYLEKLAELLTAKNVDHPEKFRLNARRVLYSQMFRASLPFDQFMEDDGVWRGYVKFKKFTLDDLNPQKSPTIQVVLDGILKNLPFIRQI